MRRSIVAVGCLITILAQGLDPSVQQIISTREIVQFARNDSARVPVAHRWSAAFIEKSIVGVLQRECAHNVPPP